jgi:hypothetical protein
MQWSPPASHLQGPERAPLRFLRGLPTEIFLDSVCGFEDVSDQHFFSGPLGESPFGTGSGFEGRFE